MKRSWKAAIAAAGATAMTTASVAWPAPAGNASGNGTGANASGKGRWVLLDAEDFDRPLRVVACSPDWANVYGLQDRATALGQPLGKLLEVGRETTAAIIEALNGRAAEVELTFYSGYTLEDTYLT